jgi:pimeloyl-ACP methyl ester carboxylesterase
MIAGLFLLGLAIPMAGAGYESVSRMLALRSYPPPGALVDVDGGRRIHIDCRGHGSPTLVLIHGFDNRGSVTFSKLLGPLARMTRTCAIDRAGIMWSDPDPAPFSAEQQARDMRRALSAAGERAPFVLMPHSLGGPYALIFTALYPRDVAGLVTIDASHPDQLRRFHRIVGDRFDARQLQPALDKVASLAWTGLPRIEAAFQGGDDAAPAWLPKADLRIGGAFALQSSPALARENRAIPAILATAGRFRQRARHPYGDRPLVVLTAGDGMSADEAKSLGISPAESQRIEAAWLDMARDAAGWSTCGTQRVVPGTQHYIQYMRPDAVVAAAADVVGEVRRAAGGKERTCPR